jgi:hypothetical protein
MMKKLMIYRRKAVKKNRLIPSNIIILSLILCVTNITSAQIPKVVEDNFEDGLLDTNLWEACSSDPSRNVIENNGRLEIHSNGIELAGMALHSMVNCRILLPIDKDFHVKVSFNNTGCYADSGLALVVRNSYTDSNCTIDESLCIVNGNQDPEPSGVRDWIAGKMIDFDYVEPLFTERTTESSGTFYIENKSGTFHLSHTGFGEENDFATFTIEDWTNCTEVFISLLGWDSGRQILSGNGSYFDDFSLTISDAICTHQPTMDFNGDCKVDFKDLSIFLASWLECNLDPPEACWQ